MLSIAARQLSRKGVQSQVTPFVRTFAMSAASNRKIESMTVIGAGLMGSGIIQTAAAAGVNVNVYDPVPGAFDRSRSIIEESLQAIAKKKFGDDGSNDDKLVFINEVFQRINPCETEKAAVDGVDLVIEAIVEDLKTKQDLFQGLDKVAGPGTIFATNTSSLAVSDIFATTDAARQVAGMHFFNPVPIMKLVEIVQSDRTSDETRDTLIELAKRMGKVPVVSKDTPGFIVNRLLVPFMFDAIRMAERGDANIPDIDVAMKLGAGLPMGPFQLADFVGLDTLKHIADGWREQRVPSGEIPASAVDPSKILDKLVSEGKLGCKSGEGFLGTYQNN